MYTTHGRMKANLLHRFTPESGIKPQCAWLQEYGGTWYIGTAIGDLWRQVEKAWSHDTLGNWAGAPPFLWKASNVRVLLEDGTPADRDRPGTDYITQVPSSESFKILWE